MERRKPAWKRCGCLPCLRVLPLALKLTRLPGTYEWVPHGRSWHQNNTYTGEFARGKRHGHGVFQYADGAVYDGEWKEGMKEGAATFTYTDGRTHTGEWEMDRMVNPPPVRKSSSEKSLEAVRSKYAAEIRLSDSVKELVAGLGGRTLIWEMSPEAALRRTPRRTICSARACGA